MNNSPLAGTVSIVSGARGHLGPAIVDALTEQGSKVVAVSRKFDDADSPTSHLAGTLETRSVDVTTDEWPNLLREITDRYGKIDVLVNNAHVGRSGSLASSSRADFIEALDLAVVATSEGIKAAKPGLINAKHQGGSPSIINITSMYGYVAPDFTVYDSEEQWNPPYYGAAKAAMSQLTRYAAAELGPLGIRVNSIAPGPFPSPAAQQNHELMNRLANKTLLRRIGNPEEIQTSIQYLANPASSYVTGTTLHVDGGWTAV